MTLTLVDIYSYIYVVQSFNGCLNGCFRYDSRALDLIWLNKSNNGGADICIYILVFIEILLVFFFSDSAIPVESDTDDEGAPRISLAEMLEDLHISQDATGEEGESMMT